MSASAVAVEPPAHRSTTWRLGRWALILMVLVAFARAAWALGGKSLWWDESLSLHRTGETLAYALSNRIILTDNLSQVVTIDNHPPLYFALLWLLVQLLGQSEFALRYLSLAAVVLIVPLLYITGRDLVDERAGLAAAALGALSPMYLWYGQEARMYSLLALLSLLSFYLFVRAFFRPGETVVLRRQWPWIAAYLVVTACLVFTHYLGALVVAFQLVALGWLVLRRMGNRRAFLLVMIAVLVVAVLPLAYAWLTRPQVARRPGFNVLLLPTLLRDLLNSFSLGLSVDVGDWYVLLIDLVFLLFVIAGLVWLVRPGATEKWRTSGWLLAGYLFLPIVLVYGLSYWLPVYMNSRHLIFISPAFYLLVAVGLSRLRGRLATVAVVASVLMIGGVSYSTYNYFYNPAYDKDHHREWGAYLHEHVRPGDVVVVNPPHIADLYEYYAGSEVPWVGLPLLNASPQDTEAKLKELLQQYDRVWLALSYTPPWGDRRLSVEKWLNENAFRADYVPFKSYASIVEVANYLPAWPSVPGLPKDAQPLAVQFTPQLRLVGYRFLSQPQPGKLLHVELFWAVDDFIPEQASVRLRLVDKDGHLWGEGEQCPFNGLYPMWQWQPGLLLRDEHEVLIAPGTPPGEYKLELGLVSRPGQENCSGAAGPLISPMSAPPELDRGDRVLLGAVAIQQPGMSPSQDDLGIEQPRRARFDGLELLAADVMPTELMAGERLDVTLYWEALKSSLADAQLRLRLVDPEGVSRQELVIRPAGDSYPADRWAAGERFKGQFSLWLPEDAPAGRYQLELIPEPPLQQKGLRAALRQVLGRKDAGVGLGSVEVKALPSTQPAGPVPPVPDLSLSNPVLATLGDQVRLLGYELESESIQAGETLSFTLYWQALSPMNFSYSVFTHLLGPSNQVLAQKDGVPRDGTYPTTLWQVGEVVADPYRIVINPDIPPGRYQLEVGMYRPETGKRLAVVDASGQPLPDDRILLPEITVLPGPASTATPSKEDTGSYGLQ